MLQRLEIPRPIETCGGSATALHVQLHLCAAWCAPTRLLQPQILAAHSPGARQTPSCTHYLQLIVLVLYMYVLANHVLVSALAQLRDQTRNSQHSSL